MNRCKTLLVDDHPVILKGVAYFLTASGEFEIVGEATSRDECLAAALREQPDLVILDLRLGDTLAPDLCRELYSIVPQAKVVIFTAFTDRHLLQACLEAQVSGVLLKDVLGLDLIRALRQILCGRTVVDERIALEQPKGSRQLHDPNGHIYDPLTSREYDVLRLLARGMTSREIAAALHLATNTVRSYLQSLLTKLYARNRIQAIEAARRLGLI